MASWVKHLLVAAGIACWLAACGGGGGGSSTDGGTSANTDGGATTTDGGTTTTTDGGTTGGGTTTDGGTTGGGTTTVTGVELPSNMSVVTAVDSGVTTSSIADTASLAADSDYQTDPAEVHVFDPSMEALGTVNMILCLMDQIRAADMVNQGPYIALVDEDMCEEGSNDSGASSGGQASTSNVKQYNKWTIVSTRESDDTPMIVQIWIPGKGHPEDPRDAQKILVEVTASEGVSDTKPFGSFVLNFHGVADAGLVGGTAGTMVTLMKGTLQTVNNDLGQPQFRFAEVGGEYANPAITDFADRQAASVVLDDAAGTGGVAKTLTDFMDGWGSMAETYVVAFDETHLLRGKDTNGDDTTDAQACMSRLDFNTQVWRYNLYHAADGTFAGAAVTAGQRVEMSSGFPFRYATGGETVDGWLGYWGPWVEGDQTLPDGATITKMSFDGGATTDYTVHISNGRLIRRTANELAIGKLAGEQLFFWGENPATHEQRQWLAELNANTLAFEITGSVEWGDSGPEVTPIDVPVDLTPEFDGGNLWMWSDGLGGNIVYVHNSAVPAANRMVTFYAEETIYPNDETLFGSDTSTTLYCYDRCLKGGLTHEDVAAATSEWDLYYPNDGTAHAYTLTVTDGKAVLSNADGEVSTVGLDLDSLGIGWGMHTGEMVTDASGITHPWEIYNQPVSYRWETGSENWNRLITVTDADGGIVTFDKPLQFTYTLAAGDEANGDPGNNAGKVFLLQYEGAGNLHGFPWKEDPATHRWYSAVNLKDGVRLSDGTHDFVVKGLGMEQSLQEAPGDCAALNVDNLFSDPAVALLTAEDIGTVSHTWADKPVVTDPPAVIEGNVQ